MIVRYWQPWREMETLRHQLDRVFDDLTQTAQGSFEPMKWSTEWSPAIELKEAGDTFILKAQLPGMAAKDIDVQVMKNAVSIAAERQQEQRTDENGYVRSEFRYGTFRRVVPLPVAVQNDQVQAEYKDGVLTLTLPKVTEARNKVVKINLTELEPAAAPAAVEPGTEAVGEHN